MNANAAWVYPVHIMLLNFIKDFKKFFIDHVNRIFGQLPVSISEFADKTSEDDTPGNCYGNYEETIIPLLDDHHRAAKRHGNRYRDTSLFHGTYF